jgi:hypothetical protein
MSDASIYDPKQLDTYIYNYHEIDHETGLPKQIGKVQALLYRFRKFLWFCAGADEQLLKLSPHSDHVKYEGIGGIVLATALLAFFSGSYAMYTVFGEKEHLNLMPGTQGIDILGFISAVVAGSVWSLVIFNLDRFIITSTGHGDGTSKITLDELKGSIPRILMAVVIGVCLSAPLEIRIFKSEIEAQLREMQRKEMDDLSSRDQARFDQVRADTLKKRDAILKEMDRRRDELAHRRTEIDTKVTQRDQESMGISGHHGIGPVYQALAAAVQDLEGKYKAETAQWEIDEKQMKADVAELETSLGKAQAELDVIKARSLQQAESLDGLGRRISIAHELFPVAAIFLMALLMVIEVTPVLIKMMLINGPYVYLEENQKEIIKARFAIDESEVIVNPNGVNKQTETLAARFHQAETIRDYEVGKLAVERSLAKTALEEFEQRTKQDVSSNLDKYLSPRKEG